MNSKLNPGDTFPALTLNVVGGESVDLPIQSDLPLTIALFYRGHW